MSTGENVEQSEKFWIHQGGMFRCCLETAHEHGPGVQDRQVLPCKYCSDSMTWLGESRAWKGTRWVEEVTS